MTCGVSLDEGRHDRIESNRAADRRAQVSTQPTDGNGGLRRVPGVAMGHDFPCWLAVVLVGLGICVVMVACFAWVVRSGE